MKRRVFAWLMVLCMLLSAMPAMATEWDCAEQGHEYTSTTLREGSCTVKGIVKDTCIHCDDVKYVSTYMHSMEYGPIDATCGEPAKVGEQCTVCGEEGETTLVEGSEALGHDMVLDTENEAYVAATCEEGGHDTLKCSRCDYTEENDTEALGHDWDEGVHTEATCDAASGVLYTCFVCGETKVEEYPEGIATPALGHDYEAVVTEPTCAEGGYTTYTCANCGDEYVADETDPVADAHVWDVNVLKEATCTTAGIARKTCQFCDASIVTTTEIKHTWSDDKGGNNCVYQECTACGEIVIVEIFEGFDCADLDMDHTEVSADNAVEATCTEAGKEADTICSVCGKLVAEGAVIEALGHDEVSAENAVGATCTEAGKEADTVCSVCGETITEGSVIDALGHNIVADAAVEATCTEAGLTAGEHCTACDYEVAQEVVPAKGHNIVADAAVEATCTEAGLTAGEHCTACDYEVAQEVVPAKGHNHKVSTVKAPTCTEGGYTTYVCDCGDSYTGNETAATGHSYKKSYNLSADGTKRIITYTCTACGNTYSEEEEI